MKNCVIIAGADISNYELISSHLSDEDFYIYCDSGLKHMEKLGRKPDLIVGDFDSFENPNLNIETLVLPCEKDDTDSIFAIKEGIARGYENFLLVGVVGGRFDHSFVNISSLLYLEKRGKHGKIIDDFSEMELVNSYAEVEEKFSFFSLMAIAGDCSGVSIKNAKYPLDNAKIECDYQYGISNEVIAGKTAEITIKNGKLLLIKVL